MNREEALYKANHLRKVHPSICIDAEDFWDTVIAALEQESCDDCVRRSDIGLTDFEMVMCNGDYKEGLKMLLDKIEKAPSVSPMPKMGRWITWKEAGNDIPSETRFECSVCHDAAQTLCNGLDLLSTYCPNCGAKMENEI